MSRISEKLEHFANDVMADVGEERRKLVEIVDKEIREELETREKELLEEAYEIVQSALIKIDQEKNAKKLSQVIMDNRMKLLNKRNELLNRMVDKVKDKLLEFKSSPEYVDHLVGLVEDATKLLGDGEITICVDFSDRHLGDELKKRTGYEVTCESKKVPLLGGCKVFNLTSQVIVDNSFIKKLEDHRDGFIQLCKLEID